MQQYLPFVILLAGMGFLLYLSSKQRRKAAERTQRTQAGLEIGAPVTMTCGLYGSVAGLQEKTIDVKVSPGVTMRFMRQAVMDVRDPLAKESGTGSDQLGTDEATGSSS